MSESVIQRAFAAGELAPALYARADVAKYTTGLRACRNFLVRKEGGVANRPGTRFISAIKDSTVDSTFLFKYVGDTPGESVLIEAGNGYLRFFHNGAKVSVTGVGAYNGATAYVPGDLATSGGITYWAKVATTGNAPPNATYWAALPAGVLEIPHPFLTHRFNVSQNGHVLTLTHQDIAPQELTYGGLTHWALTPVTTAPVTPTPQSLTVAQGTPGPGNRIASYVVTAAKAETYEESLMSAPATTTGAPQLGTADAPNVLAWTAVTGAVEYYVYADYFQNGVFGYIGTASINSFKDPGLVADVAITPPQARNPFTGATNYPHVSTSYQQRRFFGSTAAIPDGVWASRTGFPSNFAISSPLQDDDAITFRIDGSGPVRWLMKMKTLIVLADAGEWVVGEARQALLPQSIPTDQETYVGSSDKQPVVIGNSIIYLQARGSVFRELVFDRQVEGWAGRDLSIFSGHLFKGYSFFKFDYQQTPDSIVWVVRSDGTLLGLTYVPEQDIWGWHRHDTDGSFEDVCVVPEAGEDVPYVIVKRTIGGATKRYVEKLESRVITTWDQDAFFVDAGLSYSGVPATTFTGLSHLEGKIVAVVADGATIFDGDPASSRASFYTVRTGAITLTVAASEVHIGLKIPDPEIETLDMDVQGSSVRDKRKRIASLSLLIEGSSRTFAAGPDRNNLRTFVPQAWESTDDAVTGQVDLNLTSHFSDDGRIVIRQLQPLPLTILGVIPQIEMGG
jgi:hypothetical protein